MQIRAVSADDHAAWLPLWQGYQRFSVSYTHLTLPTIYSV